MLQWLRVLLGRRKFEEGMREELRFHIEQYTSDLVRSGVSAEEAARRARIEFGAINNVQEECREARGLYWFDELSRQCRYATRLLLKTPGFTATALATLAICLGANLAIFAVLDSVLLRPLPFPDAGRLVTIFNTYPKAGVERDGSSLTNYYERRGRIDAFVSLAIHRAETSLIGEPGATERVLGARVSPEFFATVGTGPMMGRAFTEEETSYQADHVVLLMHAYWQRHWNGDPQVIGRRIRVDGLAYKVIGVLPATFRFLSSPAQLYFPYSSPPQDRSPEQRHNGNSIEMVARLKPGATVVQAQAQIDAQNGALEADSPRAKMIADAGFRSVVAPLHEDHVAAIRPTLLMLQASVLLLLLIGVVNLVNLLLVRANGRMKELAVRQALGASRRHVLSEVTVETTLLTVVAGVLGCAVGTAGIRLLAALGAGQLPMGAQMGFDARTALAALAGAVFIGPVMAMPIAWFSLRSASLHAESRSGTANRAAQRMRHGFVVAQIALAFVLLAGAGLLGLSLKNALAVSPGFRQDHILTGQISLPWTKYPSGSAARLGFVERLGREMAQQPGVLAAGVVNNVPFSGKAGMSAVKVKGHTPRPGESVRGHYSYGVSGNYFSALGVSLRAGRFLTAGDTERVCVVDDDFAQHYWPGGNALGQRLFQGSDDSNAATAFTIAGVVGRVKQAGLTHAAAQGAIYYPYPFRADNDLFVVVRTGLPPEALSLTLQKVVRSIDGDLPLTDVRSMETRIAESLLSRRSPTLLAGLFSVIAMLLTAIGTYGVLSYAVAQRRREIAVRMALGARPEQIGCQFLSLALRLYVCGSTLGLIGAWLTGQAMQPVLFQTPALNWATLGGAAGVMGLVSLLACLLPAHRAARTSPMEALAE